MGKTIKNTVFRNKTEKYTEKDGKGCMYLLPRKKRSIIITLQTGADRCGQVQIGTDGCAERNMDIYSGNMPVYMSGKEGI
ncbi:MAG: hypothetical protein LUK37_07135 [Clostridia bacterium]|nr:hypothetical protein [Clostridia bacterium]